MCYVKPGPRCNKEAFRSLVKAVYCYNSDPTPENRANLIEKRDAYYLTSEGIGKLRKEGENARADEFQKRRDSLIAQVGGKKERSHLKDMDTGELRDELIRISEDTSIDWGSIDKETFQKSLKKAIFWHRNQTRRNRGSYRWTAYAEHPLRNAVRAYRWGYRDGEGLTGIILHDTLEDCADEIALIGKDEMSATELREKAQARMKVMFGERVTDFVSGVTNPIWPKEMPKEQKNKLYVEHLRKELPEDKDVFLIKFSDLMDNAGGLHHNYLKGQEKMVSKSYAKYLSAIPVFKESYDSHRGNLSSKMQKSLDRSFESLENNLDYLGKRLEQDGWIKVVEGKAIATVPSTT